jgi:hypothetical protein
VKKTSESTAFGLLNAKSYEATSLSLRVRVARKRLRAGTLKTFGLRALIRRFSLCFALSRSRFAARLSRREKDSLLVFRVEQQPLQPWLNSLRR